MKREPMRDELIGSAERIVSMSKDAEAQEVLDFVKRRSMLGLVRSNGVSLLDTPTSNTVVAFAPVFPEDVKALQSFPALRDVKGGLGSFLLDAAYPAICIRCDRRLSWFTEGMVLLHEGDHAKESFERKQKARMPDDAYADELRVWEFQRRIEREAGGEHYGNAVTNAMRLIKDTVAENGSKIGETFGNPGFYDTELDLAFGKAQSDVDRTSRQTALDLDANFLLLEKAYTGDELQKYKKLFIKLAYRPEYRH